MKLLVYWTVMDVSSLFWLTYQAPKSPVLQVLTMPFTMQDFSSVSSRPKSGINTKPSNISVTKNLKKTLQLSKDIDIFYPKTGKEFKIFAGMQEYAIRRYNDVYIVKPCSSKYTDVNDVEENTLNFTENDKMLSSKKINKNRAQSAKIINSEAKVINQIILCVNVFLIIS